MLRKLDNLELNAVSGGSDTGIIVVAMGSNFSFAATGFGGTGFTGPGSVGAGLSGGSLGEVSTTAWDPHGDDDGDGIENQFEWIQVEGATHQQIVEWNQFANRLADWTQWYALVSSALAGVELQSFKVMMEAAIGKRAAAAASAVAGALVSDVSEPALKDFWFQYARDMTKSSYINYNNGSMLYY